MEKFWRFEHSGPNEVERDPIQEEFFSSSNTLTDLSSLVRESIQNSLDAHSVSGGQKIKVAFTLGKRAIDSETASYFQDLGPHLKASLTSSHHLQESGDCRFLVVEDFGTTGLLGEVDASASEAEANPDMNSFRYFRWSNGSSSKAEGKRGKWGIGKVVFPKSSAIKTFFAYSVRMHNGVLDQIVFGQCLLKFHSLEGIRHKPDGWWGQRNSNDMDIPHGSEVVPSFLKTWDVKRKSTETGLTLVVPFIDDTFTLESIRDCVVRDYFIAIADGTLEVEIYDYQNQEVSLNQRTLIQYINQLTDAKVKTAVGVMAEIYLDHNRAPLELVEIGQDSKNQWANVALDEQLKSDLRQKLDEGTPLVFKVHTSVPKSTTRNEIVPDHFLVFLRAEKGVRERPLICREGILIPDAYRKSLLDMAALCLISSGPLADLLGDAEGPAHERWSENGDKFKDKYSPKTSAREVLVWVRNSAAALSKLLRVVDDGKDDYLLGKFFPFPDGGDLSNETPRGVDPDGDGTPKGPSSSSKFEPPSASPVAITVGKVGNGFKIRQADLNSVGRKFKVSVAYQVRRGNSFSKWQIEDFDLSKKMTKMKGAEVTFAGNEIKLIPQSSDFEVVFSEFDGLRDLIFRVEELS